MSRSTSPAPAPYLRYVTPARRRPAGYMQWEMAEQEHRKAKYRPLEIGNQAVWSVSSCKPGYGVSQLRDGSTETYWQWVVESHDVRLLETWLYTGLMDYSHTSSTLNSWEKWLSRYTHAIYAIHSEPSHIPNSNTTKQHMQQIAVFTDYRQDESYTPSKIAIRAGSHFHDLQVNFHFNKDWSFVTSGIDNMDCVCNLDLLFMGY